MTDKEVDELVQRRIMLSNTVDLYSRSDTNNPHHSKYLEKELEVYRQLRALGSYEEIYKRVSFRTLLLVRKFLLNKWGTGDVPYEKRTSKRWIKMCKAIAAPIQKELRAVTNEIEARTKIAMGKGAHSETVDGTPTQEGEDE
jgi:hypothetical protein